MEEPNLPTSLPLKPKLIVKYIYANVQLDRAASSSSPFNIHQVDDVLITQNIPLARTFVTRTDLFKLLKDDGAYFYHDTIRIFNSQTQTFVRLLNDFRYELSQPETKPEAEIDQTTQLPHEILLWIQGIDKPFKNRIKSLNQKVKKLEKQQKEMLAKFELVSPVAELPRTVQNRFSDPEIYLPGSVSRRSSILPGNTNDKGDESLVHSLTNLHLNHQCSKVDPLELAGSAKQKLDLAIMYAEPLVRREGKNVSTLPDAVDYEEECSKIYETLDQKGLQIDLIIEIATRENLINVLSRSPTILHIICHGEFDNERNQFYLCFENEDGQMDPIYASDLRSILETLKTRVQIVFVNACHSEQVARVFEDAGVPCVIAVQSQLQIADVVARKFALEFYNYLFDSFSLGEAFENARLASRSADSLSCCCAHAHKRDCKWYKKASTEGYYKAHLYHDPCCTNCPKAKEHVHRYACKWANEFLQESLQDHEDILDPIRFDADNMEIKTCCCSPDLPHDESMKFLKLLQKSCCELDKVVFFEDMEQGKVVNRKHYNILEQKYPIKRLIGRNKSMHELFKLVKAETKFLILHGSTGVGKSALVKQLANYLYARDYYRFKIAIIMMEKITSVSYFKSELMKEIDFAYDFKSFCQAVKHKECLFILEKCDGIIERNRHDFVEFLNEIAENTKKVSFILITNQAYQLNLRASSVELGNLSAVDAAKLLLLSTNTDKLSWRVRNIDTLKRSKLFQENQSFSPHAIWWISQRLNQCGDFEKVEKEILEKQITFGTENSQAISYTLENIKKDNPEGYSLLHLITIFPSGLVYEDIEELYNLQFLEFGWRESLLNLLSQGEEAKSSAEEQELEPEEVLDLGDEEEAKEEQTPRSRRTRIKPGNYFWITIAKGPDSTLYFKPAQSIYQFITKNLRNEFPEWQFAKLEYLTLFALTLIERAKAHYFYHEKLIENSGVCAHSIWTHRKNNYFYKKHLESEMTSIYLQKMSFEGMKELWNIFQENETNFLSCLEMDFLKPLLASEEYKEKVLDIIEILWIAIPTCFKIYSSRTEGTIALTSSIIGRLSELGLANELISKLKIKLHLLIMAISVNQKQEAETLFNAMVAEYELIDKIKLDIKDESWIKGVKVTVDLTKAFFFYKLRRGRYANADRIHMSEDQKRVNKIQKILKYNCEKVLEGLDSDFDFERAVTAFLIFKAKMSTKKLRMIDQFETQLTKATATFVAINCKKLELKARFLMAELQLLLYKERDRLGQVHVVLQNANKLDEIKKHNLQENALRIVREINDSSYETKIKTLINKINQEIRESFFNIIFFLRSSPLLHNHNKNLQAIHQHSPELTTCQGPNELEITIKSYFKSDLIHSLRELQKSLHLKFEVLTLKSLSEAFDSGCRILQLSLDYAHEDGLVAEDSEGIAHLVTYQQMKEMIIESRMKNRKSWYSGKYSGEKNVELIVFACKNQIKLAQFFSQELNIPFVITFLFKPREPGTDQVNSHILLFESEFIDKFNMFFFAELVEGKTVQKSFDIALRNSFDCIACSFFLGKETMVKELLGDGAVLLISPDNKEGNTRKLFGSDEFQLPKGVIEDISTVLSPSNLQKSILPFIGRKEDICEIIRLLGQEEKTNFLKVTGEAGSGKTRLVLEAAYYMLVRNHFPDGVFYFPLKKYWKTNLLDMLKKVLNSESFGSKFEKNIKNLFRNKKMLLIFDDFDSFYENMVEFPYLIFSVLQLCQISTIVVTTSNNAKSPKLHPVHKRDAQADIQAKIESEFIKSTWKIPRLSLEESGLLISALTEIEFGIDATVEEITKLTAVRQAKGNPAKLVKLIKEEKIIIEDSLLKLNPNYQNELELDKKYKGLVKKTRGESERVFALNVSRHSSVFYSNFIQQELLKHKKSYGRSRNQLPSRDEDETPKETPEQAPRTKIRTKTLEVKLAQQVSLRLAHTFGQAAKDAKLLRPKAIMAKESSEDDDDYRETNDYSAYANKLAKKSKVASLVLEDEDPTSEDPKEIKKRNLAYKEDKISEKSGSENSPMTDDVDESIIGNVKRRNANAAEIYQKSHFGKPRGKSDSAGENLRPRHFETENDVKRPLK